MDLSKTTLLAPNHGGDDPVLPLCRLTLRSKATILVLLLWTAHLAFNVVGLQAYWSTTSVKVVTNPPSDLDQTTDLYTSTFWDNVQQFWDAGAQPVAAVIVVGGLVQPILKTIAMLVIAFRPMTSATRDAMLTQQEFTSRLSITPFYVEAILLEALTYTWRLPRLNLDAKVYIKVYSGLMCFFIGQLTALVMFNVMRLLQKERAHQDALMKGCYTPRSGTKCAANDAVFDGDSGPADRGKRKDASAGYAVISPVAAAAVMGDFSDDNDGVSKGHAHGVEGSSDSSSGSSSAATSRADESSSSNDSTKHRDVRSNDDDDEHDEPMSGLTRDRIERQENRDLRRAAVVLPAAGLCLGAFGWLWSVGPFIRFDTSGLLGPYIVDNGPHLELGLKSLADGLLTQIHPANQAIPYAFFYYMNLVMVPGAIAVLAAVDALLPLASQFARRHLEQQRAQSSRSSFLATLSDPFWVANVRVSLRDAVQLVAPYDTSLTAVVAVFFIAPNMGTVAQFMFDATPPCPQVGDATGGVTECVIVKATVLDTGGFLLLIWASLLMFLTRSVLKGQQGLSGVVMGGSLKQAARSSRLSGMQQGQAAAEPVSGPS